MQELTESAMSFYRIVGQHIAVSLNIKVAAYAGIL